MTVRRDGEVVETRTVPVGAPQRVDIPIPHGGRTCRDRGLPARGELTRSTTAPSSRSTGCAKVAGAAGLGRAKRRRAHLAQPAEVRRFCRPRSFHHLRPPEKQDGTPINELSLIAFPTRELFQQKIGEFQLIIFDRYARQGVLPIIYFDNITRYVREAAPCWSPPVLICEPDQHLAHTARFHPAGGAERQCHRARLSRPPL